MGFQPGANPGTSPPPTPGKQAPAGTHFDAQGNLVDDATGAIITTAAALGAQGQYGTPDSLSNTVGVDPNSTLGKAINDNPLLTPIKVADDLVHGNPSGVAGDLISGGTFGQVGSASDVAGKIRAIPGAVQAAGSAVADGARDLVNGVGNALSPNASDTTGLNRITDKALSTQDALTGRLQGLEANPTVAPQSQLVQLDQTNIDPLRQRQTTALDHLQAAAEGRVPSAAEILGRDQANRAAAQAYGNAAALQGGNSSGGTLRQALDAQTQIQGDANTQLMAARAREMSDARNQLVTGVGNARGQESTDATTNANLDQNKNLANTTAAVQTHGQDVSQQGDLISGQNTALGTAASAEKAKVDADTANAASANAYKGALVSGAASAIPKLLSDRRAKTDIHKADLVQLAEVAPGYTFEYKDPSDGPGRRVSVMAQDVQRSRMGKDLVQMGGDGDLVLDGQNSVGAALAMSAAALRAAEALKKRRR